MGVVAPYLRPVAVLTRVDAPQLIRGEAIHGVVLIDKENECFPPDGGEFQLHALLCGIGQLLLRGGDADGDIHGAVHDALVGASGVGILERAVGGEAFPVKADAVGGVDGVDEARENGVEGRRAVDDGEVFGELQRAVQFDDLRVLLKGQIRAQLHRLGLHPLAGSGDTAAGEDEKHGEVQHHEQKHQRTEGEELTRELAAVDGCFYGDFCHISTPPWPRR